MLIVDIRVPPTFTTKGLDAALEIRRRCPEIGVLVLSQQIETAYAMDLMADNAAGVGYLFKDRVTALDDFLDSLGCIAGGGSASTHHRGRPPPSMHRRELRGRSVRRLRVSRASRQTPPGR